MELSSYLGVTKGFAITQEDFYRSVSTGSGKPNGCNADYPEANAKLQFIGKARPISLLGWFKLTQMARSDHRCAG